MVVSDNIGCKFYNTAVSWMREFVFQRIVVKHKSPVNSKLIFMTAQVPLQTKCLFYLFGSTSITLIELPK